MPQPWPRIIAHVGDKCRLPWPCSGKESACQARDVSSNPGSGTSPGGGNGNPLQYSCLESPMNRGAWQAAAHGVTKNQDTTEHTHTVINCAPIKPKSTPSSLRISSDQSGNRLKAADREAGPMLSSLNTLTHFVIAHLPS